MVYITLFLINVEGLTSRQPRMSSNPEMYYKSLKYIPSAFQWYTSLLFCVILKVWPSDDLKWPPIQKLMIILKVHPFSIPMIYITSFLCNIEGSTFRWPQMTSNLEMHYISLKYIPWTFQWYNSLYFSTMLNVWPPDDLQWPPIRKLMTDP